jgi:heat shock protein HtpX
MSLIKLRFTMLGTLALIITISTLFFTLILTFVGIDLNLILIFVVGFNILQWLIAPYLIDGIYRVKDLPTDQYSSLISRIEAICQKSEIKMPRLRLAAIPLPNAFAYGSPIAGRRIAVTQGLLDTLDEDEIEAVVGHEVGHLKHHDVQIMMFASVLPAIFYYIGFSLMLSGSYGNNRQKNAGAGVLLGFASMALYWVLTLFVLGLSRLREYYADQHSAQVVPQGAEKLSVALAKISSWKGRGLAQLRSANAFRSLFITDPETTVQEGVRTYSYKNDRQLVEEIVSRKITGAERFTEIFSTHPNIVKRLKALRESAS